jgi:hypothetical protein
VSSPLQTCQDKLAAIRRDQGAIRRRQYAATSCPICLEEFTGTTPPAPPGASTAALEVPEGKGRAATAAAVVAEPEGVSGAEEGKGQGRRAAAGGGGGGGGGADAFDVEEVGGVCRFRLLYARPAFHLFCLTCQSSRGSPRNFRRVLSLILVGFRHMCILLVVLQPAWVSLILSSVRRRPFWRHHK